MSRKEREHIKFKKKARERLRQYYEPFCELRWAWHAEREHGGWVYKDNCVYRVEGSEGFYSPSKLFGVPFYIPSTRQKVYLAKMTDEEVNDMVSKAAEMCEYDFGSTLYHKLNVQYLQCYSAQSNAFLGA